MKNKKLLFNGALLLSFSLLNIEVSMAQMVGTDAYVKGNYVEFAVNGAGGFEGVDQAVSPAPAGYHARTTALPFGFISDPLMDAWTLFDGDFYTPGSPENGWGIEIGTTGGPSGSNNYNLTGLVAGTPDIPGAITSYTYAAGTSTVIWEGDMTTGTNLHVKITYVLNDPDMFYSTSVDITNNTASPISDIYYYRNYDPDNNVELSGDFSTTNTIVSQPVSGTSAIATVTATSIVPSSQPMSYTCLAGLDSNWRVCYGGFSNRDASDIYTGTGFTQAVGSSDFADEAIAMAYHIAYLPAGSTQTMRNFLTFNNTATASLPDKFPTGIATNKLNNTVTVYPNPFNDATTISLGSIDLKNAEVHIFDVLGQEVQSVMNIHSSQVNIERKNLADGTYIYKVINNGQNIATGKMQIKK